MNRRGGVNLDHPYPESSQEVTISTCLTWRDGAPGYCLSIQVNWGFQIVGIECILGNGEVAHLSVCVGWACKIMEYLIQMTVPIVTVGLILISHRVQGVPGGWLGADPERMERLASHPPSHNPAFLTVDKTSQLVKIYTKCAAKATVVDLGFSEGGFHCARKFFDHAHFQLNHTHYRSFWAVRLLVNRSVSIKIYAKAC